MAIIFMIKFFFRNVPKNPHKTVANTNNSSLIILDRVPIDQKILKIMGGIFGQQIDCFGSIIIIEKNKSKRFRFNNVYLARERNQ